MRKQALEQWRSDSLIWAAGTAFASKRPNPPAIPEILKERRHGDA